ncbi:MAG: hypothetical protein D6682_01825, partial [Zetaproteobacteria bacterium]
MRPILPARWSAVLLLLPALSCGVPAALAHHLDAAPASASEAEAITPDQVFAQAERIKADILTIMAHHHIAPPPYHRRITVRLRPRHVWQKTYEILTKINILRRKEHYPTLAVGTLDPTEELLPGMVYDQTWRILTELHLIKMRLGLAARHPTPPPRPHHGKRPTDVYLLLDEVSSDLDALNGAGFTPSDLFAQVMRLNGDIDAILRAMELYDRSFPPPRQPGAKPAEAMRAAVALLATTQRLQRKLGLATTDLARLVPPVVHPKDLFEMVGLIIAELQPVKYLLGLTDSRTPVTRRYRGKHPAD